MSGPVGASTGAAQTHPEPPASRPTAPEPPSGVASTVSAVVVGALVGLAGTLVHRWSATAVPEGMVAALLLVVVGGVFARAAADRAGVVLHVLAALLTAMALTYLAPNADVLVSDDLVSRLWLLGLPLAGLVAALTPRSWYADRPRGSRR